jgi:hypothetical protein
MPGSRTPASALPPPATGGGWRGAVDRGGSTYDAVQQKGIISGTEGIFVLNLGGAVETIN